MVLQGFTKHFLKIQYDLKEKQEFAMPLNLKGLPK